MDTTETATNPRAEAENREILMKFWELVDHRDFEAAARLAHPDVVMSWPQSGERFTGRDNALAAMRATEEKPEMADDPRIIGAGEVWVTTLPLRYGDEVFHYVGIFEFESGLIVRTTEYFGAPFAPQEARAPYADPT